MDRTGITKLIGKKMIHVTVHDAVIFCQRELVTPIPCWSTNKFLLQEDTGESSEAHLALASRNSVSSRPRAKTPGRLSNPPSQSTDVESGIVVRPQIQ